MLNPSKKYGNAEDNLQKSIACILAKQFNPSEFFPILAQITDDPDLAQPANLIFAVYNLLIRQQPQTAFNGLAKIQENNPSSAANIAGLVVKSAYDAYTKKYKQSLESLNKALTICEQPNADRQFVAFYAQVIARMIQIHDFSAFRRQYLNYMEKILKKYEDQVDNQILRAINHQRENLKQKKQFWGIFYIQFEYHKSNQIYLQTKAKWSLRKRTFVEGEKFELKQKVQSLFSPLQAPQQSYQRVKKQKIYKSIWIDGIQSK